MSGTLQLLFYMLLFGASTGVGIAVYSDAGWGRLILAILFWAAFFLYLADAFWSPFSPRGRQWVDRIGIFITALGFGMTAFAMIFAPSLISLIFAAVGIGTMMFGRIFWELFIMRFSNN